MNLHIRISNKIADKVKRAKLFNSLSKCLIIKIRIHEESEREI
jgi:hypothetical protein